MAGRIGPRDWTPRGPVRAGAYQGVIMTLRAKLRRWHMWLGGLVGVPVLFWTVSGFVMVARPIEEVRGTALLRDPAPLALAAPAVTPALMGMPVASLTLEPRAAGPRWVIH